MKRLLSQLELLRSQRIVWEGNPRSRVKDSAKKYNRQKFKKVEY